jgi:hypothetical protein
MYFMYVDESGDKGVGKTQTRYFVLTGLVVHELRWRPCLDQLVAFRRRIRAKFGLRLREELHAARMLARPGGLVRIKRHDRLAIIRAFADEIASMTDLNVVNVVVDKEGKPEDFDVFDTAWKALIQRFENTVARRNFAGPANADDRGVLFPDHSEDTKLTALVRRMHHYNPVPNRGDLGPGYRNLPLVTVVEDPNFRDSEYSYFIQAADCAAFLLYQRLAPNLFMKKHSGQNYFKRLEPVLCKVVAPRDPWGLGVVWL